MATKAKVNSVYKTYNHGIVVVKSIKGNTVIFADNKGVRKPIIKGVFEQLAKEVK